jgi:MerR family copper efflux transcriptional regulator
MMAMVGIDLGQGRGCGCKQAEQSQGDGGESHRTGWGRTEHLPCTLHQGESQVAARQPVNLSPRELEKIGAVASRSGLTVKTIRFYCDEGLIQPSSRSEGGYRLFDEAVFAELTLIRTLRAMEISLQDVRQILAARRSGVCTCSELKARIRSKAGEIGAKIMALQGLQAELFGMLDSWEACGGTTPAAAPAVRVESGH